MMNRYNCRKPVFLAKYPCSSITGFLRRGHLHSAPASFFSGKYLCKAFTGFFRRNRLYGSVTIFMSLILLLMISMVFTLTASAAFTARKALLSMQIKAIERNFCASHNSGLATKYGLFYFGGTTQDDPEAFIEKELSYVSSPAYGSSAQGISLISPKSVTLNQLSSLNLCSEGGKNLESEICSWALLDTGVKTIDNLSNYGNLLSDCSSAIKCVKAVSGFASAVEDLSSTLSNICSLLKTFTDLSDIANLDLGEIKDILTELEEYQTSASDETASDSDTADFDSRRAELLNSLKEKLNSWKKHARTASDTASDLIDALDTYLADAASWQEKVSEVMEQYESSEFASSLWGSYISELFSAVTDYTQKSGSIVPTVDSLKEILSDWSERTLKIDQTASSICEAISDAVESDTQLQELKASAADAIATYTRVAWSDFMNTLQPDSSTDSSDSSSDSGQSTLASTLSRIADEGVLALLLDGQSAPDRVLDTEDFPSESRSSGSLDSSSIAQLSKDALVCGYCSAYFSSFTSSDHLCDLEYIINGADNDSDNLTATAGKLFLIREGFNLLYLFQDSEKRYECQTLAAALPGVAAVPAAQVLVSFLLMAAWAAVESVYDVRLLLNNGKVPIFKNSATWHLSVNAITDFLTSLETAEGGGTGYNYGTWLQFLLFTTDRSDRIYRIMDLIGLHMKEVQSDFSLENCIYSVNFNVSAGSESFPALAPSIDGAASF